ncbi:hypothetical protein EXU57_20125 [Segetibacter sp. 3557_3]|uniref:hypothetical protein n=1 Tax=Segetibacter sp. 3557_3 TaxID=2547429 RepID=UPI001058AE90|nr:hypothetical protein [Segetibacter sp. 3557_3]TDH21250.1 hypothetical protein EXU57_20125 [Segetibacter sp. 3557_3]
MNNDLANNEKDQNTTKQKWEEMQGERMNNDQDPSLGTPQEANTTKHVNFRDDNSGTSTETTGEHGLASQQWKEMREERKNNDQDPALGSPQDANTDKHINFTENE